MSSERGLRASVTSCAVSRRLLGSTLTRTSYALSSVPSPPRRRRAGAPVVSARFPGRPRSSHRPRWVSRRLARRSGSAILTSAGASHSLEGSMTDRTYRVTEIVGTSPDGIETAIRNGMQRAAQTLRHLDWFEVTEIRGQLRDGEVAHYQVGMKVGFRLGDGRSARLARRGHVGVD